MIYPAGEFGVAVIGAGHAGIEAALAAARMGMRTVCFTVNLDSVGNMPCNPAIGGTGKGHLVRELDALGGEMGKAADETGIQFRMLNRGKGPAVWSLRVQCDRRRYQEVMKQTLPVKADAKAPFHDQIAMTADRFEMTHEFFPCHRCLRLFHVFLPPHLPHLRPLNRLRFPSSQSPSQFLQRFLSLLLLLLRLFGPPLLQLLQRFL